ncbi:MAG TPA: sulfite reductase subunit A [Rhodospirillaceae bacterium]|nr:sulfite reductase subunit A [Rhodospirillaceae bacterium]
MPVGTKVVIDEAGLSALFSRLIKIGYQPIGPKVRDGAVVYEEISSPSDLPVGFSDEQEGGKYRLVPGTKGSFFEYLVGPTSWKKFLFPPRHKMWSADRDGKGFTVENPTDDAPAYAFIGVRSCELNAMKIQDKVFGFGREDKCGAGIFSDPGYVARRSKALIIGVNCSRAGKTCFCSSMGGDPHMKEGQGYDLTLTEFAPSNGKHEFMMEVGSERGALILDLLPHREARSADVSMADSQARKARGEMGRKMVPDVKDVLPRNLRHQRWDEVAERCLSCANCTMVCPTCFCSTVNDTTDLKGDHAERWRSWDSCFSIDFSYIHGGAIRRETKSRYRQWMTHKLSNWHEQYGTSGCVGCGRCITWCPVGIDITEEAKAIKNTGE